MAAHIITALNQLLEYDELTPSLANQLEAACNISTWTEDLDTQDWSALYDLSRLPDDQLASNTWRLHDYARLMLVKYTPEWERLGRPTTREEWRNRKWNKN